MNKKKHIDYIKELYILVSLFPLKSRSLESAFHNTETFRPKIKRNKWECYDRKLASFDNNYTLRSGIKMFFSLESILLQPE